MIKIKRTQIVYLVTVVAAYFAVLIQTTLLAQWGLFGGRPNLVALLLTIILVIGETKIGLLWLLAGEVMIELALPTHFGLSIFPLFLTYVTLNVFVRKFFVDPPWFVIVILGLILMLSSELIIVVSFNLWSQLFRDLMFGAIILMPFAVYIARNSRLASEGLRVKRKYSYVGF